MLCCLLHFVLRRPSREHYYIYRFIYSRSVELKCSMSLLCGPEKTL